MTLPSVTCLYLHLSLSPSIPTSSYLPAFYLAGSQGGRGQRFSLLAAAGESLVSIAVDVRVCFKPSKCHYADISWQPWLDSQLWLLRFMNLPACQLLQIWVIHLRSYQHLSSFRYWRMQSSRTLQSIGPTRCVLYLHFCAVWSGHLRAAILLCVKQWWRRGVSQAWQN